MSNEQQGFDPIQQPNQTIKVSDDSGFNLGKLSDLTLANQEPEDSQEESKPSENSLNDVMDDLNSEHEDSAEEFEDDSGDNEEEEVENSREQSSKKQVSDEVEFTVDGKAVKLSKDAKVSLKINGKKETLSLKEVMDNASGNIHISRETTKLGRERKQFEDERAAYKKEAMQVSANLEAIGEMKDPYELCEYIAELKGGDPDQIFRDMVKTTVETLNRYKDMTDREIEQEKELRKYRRQEKKRLAEERINNQTQETTKKIQGLETSLKSEGYTMEDFRATIDELAEKAKNNEELGFGLDSLSDPTENDIIDYMIAKDLDNRVTSSVESYNKKLLKDEVFIDKVKKAILKYESLPDVKKLTKSEVTQFVKLALQKDNKALSQSLSKKVPKTKSERVDYDEQEETNALSSLYRGLKK